MASASIPGRSAFVQRGLRLEYITLAWNSVEAFVAVLTGMLAGSIALVGFGIDSLIECVSGGALVWRLRTDADVVRREKVEQLALRLVGVGFLLLAGYVTLEAVETLRARVAPEHSIPGIALAVASLVVMPLLARAKRTVARELSSKALHADSRQTDLCAYLSAILLGGLLLNALAGWWWADPLAALAMAPIMVKEGIAALRGQSCACAPADGISENCCGGSCHGDE